MLCYPPGIVPFFERVRYFTLRLLEQLSVTETDGESRFADHLVSILREIPYFAANPEHIQAVRTEHDSCERHNVFACVRGAAATNSHTVVLAGHFDVVSIANYGSLAPLASDPAALLPSLIAELDATASADSALLQALDDLRSGDYLPGRGALDMKSGLAIGLALLERFSETPDATGNVLLIATPDEENYSHGMRSALSQLREIRAVWAVEPVLAINLDSSSVVPAGAGAFAQEVFLGSVSKLLPFAYVMGRPAHAGAPFDGISAALIAAELLCELEANPRYADEDGACMGIPPVALRAGDLKRHYDVTMPERAFLAFNMLTGTRTPGELLKQVADACENALQRASALMHSRADRCGARYAIGQGRVLTLDELRTTLHAGGVDMQMLDRLQPDERTGNVLDATRGVVERLVNCADLHGPLVVIGFAPVFYPLSRVHPAHEAAVRADLDAVATEIGIQLRYEPLFTGISDMSFLGAALSPAAFTAWQRNTAGGERWVINADASAGLGVAVLNIGPSGRDYHQRTERVHMPLSFEQAPALIWGLLRRTLARE